MAEVSVTELDPTGRDVHGEVARLCEGGPATLVLLPGEVWGVVGHAPRSDQEARWRPTSVARPATALAGYGDGSG